MSPPGVFVHQSESWGSAGTRWRDISHMNTWIHPVSPLPQRQSRPPHLHKLLSARHLQHKINAAAALSSLQVPVRLSVSVFDCLSFNWRSNEVSLMNRYTSMRLTVTAMNQWWKSTGAQTTAHLAPCCWSGVVPGERHCREPPPRQRAVISTSSVRLNVQTLWSCSSQKPPISPVDRADRLTYDVSSREVSTHRLISEASPEWREQRASLTVVNIYQPTAASVWVPHGRVSSGKKPHGEGLCFLLLLLPLQHGATIHQKCVHQPRQCVCLRPVWGQITAQETEQTPEGTFLQVKYSFWRSRCCRATLKHTHTHTHTHTQTHTWAFIHPVSLHQSPYYSSVLWAVQSIDPAHVNPHWFLLC